MHSLSSLGDTEVWKATSRSWSVRDVEGGGSSDLAGALRRGLLPGSAPPDFFVRPPEQPPEKRQVGKVKRNFIS